MTDQHLGSAPLGTRGLRRTARWATVALVLSTPLALAAPASALPPLPLPSAVASLTDPVVSQLLPSPSPSPSASPTSDPSPAPGPVASVLAPVVEAVTPSRAPSSSPSSSGALSGLVPTGSSPAAAAPVSGPGAVRPAGSQARPVAAPAAPVSADAAAANDGGSGVATLPGFGDVGLRADRMDGALGGTGIALAPMVGAAPLEAFGAPAEAPLTAPEAAAALPAAAPMAGVLPVGALRPERPARLDRRDRPRPRRRRRRRPAHRGRHPPQGRRHRLTHGAALTARGAGHARPQVSGGA